MKIIDGEIQMINKHTNKYSPSSMPSFIVIIKKTNTPVFSHSLSNEI